MGRIEAVPLPGRPVGWDRTIADYPTKTLFHESAWLDFVGAMFPRGTVEYYALQRGGDTLGFYCAARLKKVLFRVQGSPLPRAGMYMGPLFDPRACDQEELVKALLDNCRANRIAYLELANDGLDPEVMERFGFRAAPSVTHVCPLPEHEGAAWAAMRGNCRTRIRKAEKSGLVAEITDDPSVVDDFYRFMSLALRAKRLKMDYGLDRPRAMLAALLPRDRLFVARVLYRGRVIGAGFYPHDDRAMYYWDGASDPERLELCPNELLHWTAMREAIRRGIPSFNIGGAPVPSRFTRKFGGDEQPYRCYRKSFVPLLEAARRAYYAFDFLRPSPAAAERPSPAAGTKPAPALATQRAGKVVPKEQYSK